MQLVAVKMHDNIWDSRDGNEAVLQAQTAAAPSTLSSVFPDSPHALHRPKSREILPGVGMTSASKVSNWSKILDHNSLDEVLSRLSLESLARLSCVSKDMHGIGHSKLLAGGGSAKLWPSQPTVLVELRENLGPTYEPSMLVLPVRLADLPPLQRWDRYSIYSGIISDLYERLAATFPGALFYQRSM